MTPEEGKLIDDLFDRLTRLEGNQRDPEAERAIAEGLKRAPNALYALVQTALVQDEALKRADARIRELTDEPPPPEQHGSFLDTMRSALGGGRTSVPSVGPGANGGPDPRWNQGGTGYAGPSTYAAPPQTMPTPGYGGGSFLGTAAATAAGAIGGALLLNSISSMFGHHGGSAFAAAPPQSSPWDNSAAGSDLARDAGVNDVGSSGQSASDDSQAAGLFDGANDDAGTGDDFDSSDSGGFGGDDSA